MRPSQSGVETPGTARERPKRTGLLGTIDATLNRVDARDAQTKKTLASNQKPKYQLVGHDE